MKSSGRVEPLTPLAATAARLSRLDGDAGFDIGPDPAAGWVELAAAVRDGRLDAWLASLALRHGDRRAAGSLLGGLLARVVVEPTVSAMVLETRCPDPAIENLLASVDDDGELSRCGMVRPTMAVLPGDPAAGDVHSVVVKDEAALLHWWASRAGATLTPLLAAVRARAPFGLPGLWGAVSDLVTGIAVWIGRLAGRDPDATWSHAQRMVDALAGFAPVRLTRAKPFPVAHGDGHHWFQVRGTCCLSYRSILEAGPLDERYCSTCPLRDDDSRRRHLGDYLASLSTVDSAA